MNERPTVAVPNFTFDPNCGRCSGTGVALLQEVTDGGDLRITATTPCECKQPAGVTVYDLSNVIVVR